MNNVIGLSSSIRTNTGARLLRNISLARMHNSLMDLFVDRTAVDTSLRRLVSEDGIRKVVKYNKCESLNDERTIKFNQSFKQADDVFDEKRQIWINKYIDTEKDDLFIPRDDAQ